MNTATKIAITLAAATLLGVVAPLTLAHSAPQEQHDDTTLSGEPTQILQLTVTGMISPACPTVAKKALGSLAGVIAVDASYEKGSAEVIFDPGQVQPQRIVEVLREETGLGAAVVDLRPVALGST